MTAKYVQAGATSAGQISADFWDTDTSRVPLNTSPEPEFILADAPSAFMVDTTYTKPAARKISVQTTAACAASPSAASRVAASPSTTSHATASGRAVSSTSRTAASGRAATSTARTTSGRTTSSATSKSSKSTTRKTSASKSKTKSAPAAALPSPEAPPSVENTTELIPKNRAFTDLKNAITEDLFNDLYTHRRRIYRLNFVRGVCFGLGVFIGGTVIISIVIAGLSWLIQAFPDFADYIQWLVDILTR